jgi:G6PDH family F420-dependent oxidoreductase
MLAIGYKLCSEEHGPKDLVRYAQRAEESGFGFALISDHFHPWTDRQGQSPFVWSVIGAIAHTTTRLELATGVTCPTMRTHPAIIAQAAATAAAMMPGRFALGVGSGENLNEHILGERWPGNSMRLEMLEEAVQVIRLLWEGTLCSHRGVYYEVDRARIYTLPPEPPPILVAAGGPIAVDLAARIGDGLVTTKPDRDMVQRFASAGGRGKPRYAEATVCWAEDEQRARRIALEYWPTAGIASDLHQELPLPSHFEAAGKSVTEDAIAKLIVCGPDPGRHVAQIREYADAGFDHVCVHQVGPEQEGFLRFYEREVLPQLGSLRAAA